MLKFIPFYVFYYTFIYSLLYQYMYIYYKWFFIDFSYVENESISKSKIKIDWIIMNI